MDKVVAKTENHQISKPIQLKNKEFCGKLRLKNKTFDNKRTSFVIIIRRL